MYNKAIAGGQSSVVIYGPTAGTDAKIYAAFEQSYPKVKVSGVSIVGPPMDAKLSAEASSGKHIADIAFTAVPNILTYATNGWTVPFVPATAPPASQLTPGAIGPNNAFYSVAVGLDGIVTHTGSTLPVPKTWADLENPQYKGKLVMYDPTAIGASADNFAHLASNPAYAGLMQGLKNNGIALTPGTSLTQPMDDVAQGSKSMALLMGYPFVLAAMSQSAPIKFSLLDKDNYIVQLYVSQIKNAPHPLAAELYEDWLFTPQAQQALAAEGEYSPVIGAPAPAGLPALNTVSTETPLGFQETATKVNAAIAMAKQVFGG